MDISENQAFMQLFNLNCPFLHCLYDIIYGNLC